MVTFVSLLNRVTCWDFVIFLFNDTINKSECSAFPGRINVSERITEETRRGLIVVQPLQLRGRKETIPDNLQGVLRMIQSQVSYL